MAQAAAEAEADPSDVVGFPDDDCWFPNGFFENLIALFENYPTLDVFVCRSDNKPNPKGFEAASLTPMATFQAVRMATSNNMFLRGRLLGTIGSFDPELGLGTASGGGEDTDYLIRAYLKARSAGYIDRPLVGHPPPDRKSAAKYFHGALIVLAYHARSHPALAWELFRKILVGCYFTFSGEMSVAAYRRSLVSGARAFITKRSLAPIWKS